MVSKSIDEIKRQNAIWRKRVYKYGMEITVPELRQHLKERTHILDTTANIAEGLTERERIKILQAILTKREK